jgi:hypothetical protein
LYYLDGTCQITFTRSAKPAVGYDSRPRHVVVGDFNNDGDLDVAVANSGTDNIGIFLDYNNGTFATQISYPTGLLSRPYSLAVGDFNNDSRLDIVVANFGINSVGVLLGYGNGSFASQIITSLGSSRPLALAVGHFNKDNHLDIAVANYDTSTIALLFGSNDGSFPAKAIYYMGYDSIPYSLVVADFNKDNKIDIAIVNYGTSNLAILLANNNGSFSLDEYSTGTGSHPTSVAIGDFNNDNILDVAVTNSGTGNIGIFAGNGDGTFRNIIIHSIGSNSRPQSLIVIHFDNDTALDLVVIDSENNNVIVLKGDGTGNFMIATIHSSGYQSNPSSVAVGDFDNDDIPDIAIANNATNDLLVLTTYKFFPTASSTVYSTSTNSIPKFVAVGDLNNDNFTDIVAVDTNSINIGIFINLRNGTFGIREALPAKADSSPIVVAVTDVNNDTRLDIIIVMNGISEVGIFLGYGNGSFLQGDSYSTGEESYPESIAVGDLNNDGNIDITIVNDRDNNIVTLLGYGNGTFKNDGEYLTYDPFLPDLVVLSDVNNDNKLDIVTTDSTKGRIAILLGYGNGSFCIPLIFWTGDDRPTSLAIGDLNNDHHVDIVYVNPARCTIAIQFGYGNGTFGNINDYSTGSGSWPWSVAVGYLNKDTLLDIAFINTYDFDIVIWLGIGNGSFKPTTTFSTGYDSRPFYIVLSDFNNDNQLDIVVCNQDAKNIGVFLIQYKIDFAYEISYFTGSGPHPYSVATGDFNKDNQSDIIVANSGNDNIQLLLDYKQGIFMNIITYSTGFGSSPQFVNVADLNRDNQLDIIVANTAKGIINVFFGYGNTTFDAPSSHSTGSGSFPSSIAVGDFNKDNWTDIVVANTGSNNIDVFLGFEYPTFTNETITILGSSAVPCFVAVGDFNNDRQWDILVVNRKARNVGVYLGYGNGTFSDQTSLDTDSGPISLAVGDFNNDNQLDFVVANQDANNINVRLGYGNGSFQIQTTYSTGNSSSPKSVAVGYINNDNILDIVVVNRVSNSVGIFIGYGNGTFTKQTPYMLPDTSSPTRLAIVDLDNNGISDIVVANYGSDNIGLLFGYGDGTFREMIALPTGHNSGPFSIATGDLNNDTWMDIAVANGGTNNVGIFFGYGNGTFSSQKTYLTGSQSDLLSIIIRDLNNDAKLDVLVCDYGNGNGNIDVFYGYGDGNFTILKTYSTGWSSDPISVVVCDFNNDNRSDLAIAYQNKDSIGIMLRLKSEPFATPITFPTGNHSYPKSVTVGDFNNDDQLDIAVANFGINNVGILLSNGNGTFSQQHTYSTGENSEPISIAVGDFNNDNHLDIIVANSQANTIVILRGYGNGTVALLAIYSTGVSSAPSSIAVKDLNKDKYLDVVVSNYGSSDVLVFLGSGN